MYDILFITGAPGSGKSTAALFLAQKIEKSVLLSGDDLRAMVVGGGMNPAEAWTSEQREQYILSFQSEALLAKNFISAGYKVIIEDVVDPRLGLWDEWQKCFAGLNYTKVLLAPALEVVLERNSTRGMNVPDAVVTAFHGNLSRETLPDWPIVDSTNQTLEETVEGIKSVSGWQ